MRGAGRVRAVCCAATALLVAYLGEQARAAPMFHPSTKVVLFTPATTDPLVARLEAELAAVGIQVRKVSMPPNGQLDAAVSREIAAGASAAIRVIPRSRGADVWTGETTARMLRRRSSGSDTSDLSVIALRTVEFLRATLLDVKKRPAPGASASTGPVPANRSAAELAREASAGAGTGPGTSAGTERPGSTERTPATSATGEAAPRGTEAPAASRTAEPTPPRNTETGPRAAAEQPSPGRPAGPSPAEPPPEATAKPTRLPEWGLAAPPELSAPSEPLRLEIAAGPALIASPGGVDAITSVAAIGRGHVSGQAGIELMAVFPLSPGHLSNQEGTVAFKTALFGGAVVFHVDAPRHLRADAAVGASAIMLRAEGAAVGDNVGSVQTVWKVAGHVRLGGGVNLNRWLSLRADVLGGLTARTVVGYDSTDGGGKPVMTDRATWGPAFVVGMLGLQASW